MEKDIKNTKEFSFKGAGYSHNQSTYLTGKTRYTITQGSPYFEISELKQGFWQDSIMCLTVDSHATWHQAIEFLRENNNKYAISTMQSYSNFSIGGSISVNCHGRCSKKYGAISDTIVYIDYINSDGIEKRCNKDDEIFHCIIGGYGLFGIIKRVCLVLQENVIMKEQKHQIAIQDIQQEIQKCINNKDVLFFNLEVYPDYFNEINVVTYMKDENKEKKELFERSKWILVERMKLSLVRMQKWISMLQFVRKHIQQSNKPKYVDINTEFDDNVAYLEPFIHFPNTCFLQEFFVPVQKTTEFYVILIEILKKYNVNILNISLRYMNKLNNKPLMDYTKGNETIAFVLYIESLNISILERNEKWIQELASKAIDLKGSYYLCQMPFQTKQQFEQCYDVKKIREMKQKYDKNDIFNNDFYNRYIK